ncbi:MAG TPA: DUF4271 domain-containing protein [Saprospiraceae bacterium]|nr:DUF4271 domain-containing protein [Saprospiraceae bacterium]
MKAFAWILVLTLATIAPVWGQGMLNPFELTPRLAPSETAPPAWNTGNPFDVAHAVNPVAAGALQPVNKAKAKPAAKPPRPRLTTQEQYKTFLFAITVANLALLTLLITIFRGVYQKAYRGFLNENMLNQIHREAQSSGALAYYILYIMFVLNAGTFVFLVARHFGATFPWGLWQSWLMCVAGTAALVLAKHLVLTYIGAVFPVDKETSNYQFTMVVFGILLSLVLVAANVFVAYGPSEMTTPALFATFGITGLLYAFRSLRGLLIANNFLATHKFHFFLYLCAVEIAPLLVFVKLIQNQA